METTTEMALEIAKKLKKEGRSYSEIAEALRKVGYISKKTRRPINEAGVMHMLRLSNSH